MSWGGGVVSDYLDVLGDGGGAYTVDDVAQHLQLWHHEGALAEVDDHAVGGQDREELVEVGQVLRRRFAPQPAVI